MSELTKSTNAADGNWHFAKPVADLKENNVTMARVSGKQIAIFDTPQGIRACDNRCPHEGFPLSEGSISDGCTLTCNWHNWKFNLDNGDNLYGGDRLRTYPVEVREGDLWVELSDPPYAERYDTIVNSLKEAFDDHEYDRISREIARLKQLGADPLEALRLTIEWSWQKMEFGWTHAFAGMADWLMVYEENPEDAELQLVCLLESVGHASFDVLRESIYPYDESVTTYDEAGFLAAVENEDQITALAMLRGGLKDGLKFNDFERGLTHAALAHYNDFGHSLIYVTKAEYLIEKLGVQVAEPLLLSLVRSIIFASREDKIPEFSHYQATLEAWGNAETDTDLMPTAEDWLNKGINRSLKLTLSQSHLQPINLYEKLLKANALSMLNFDLSQQDKTHVPISGNVGWLDFTHALTFSNAVRKQCAKYPELWPQGLLQMTCFSGRNANFATEDNDVNAWCGDDPSAEINAILEQTYDHGLGEYIISVHWLKTAWAVREEMNEFQSDTRRALLASVKRFVHSPLRRKQTRRTAYQSLKFVAKG